MSDLTTLTLHALGQMAKSAWQDLTEAETAVGRIAVRIARILATAEARDADGLTAFTEKYLPDLATAKADEYLRGGRVVRVLEDLGVDVSDVTVSVVTRMHKCLTHRIPDESGKAGSWHDLDLWLRSKRIPLARVTPDGADSPDANAVLVLYVWTEARGRKSYPGVADVDDVMSAFGVFGSRGPAAGSESAENVNAGRKKKTTEAPAKAEAPAPTEPTVEDLAAVAREVSAVFGRITLPQNRVTVSRHAFAILRVAEKYGVAPVLAQVRTEAEAAKAEITAEAEARKNAKDLAEIVAKAEKSAKAPAKRTRTAKAPGAPEPRKTRRGQSAKSAK